MRDENGYINVGVREARVTLGCLLASLLISCAPVLADTRITFLDVGQGDAIWVHDETGFDGLVDTGSDESLAAVRLALAGITELDCILWTCDRPEHGGGIVGLMQTLPVGHLIFSGFASSSGLMSNVLAIAAQESVPLITARRGDSFRWGMNDVTVLHPEQDYGDAGENSVVVRISRHDVDVLLMSDAGWDAESALLDSGQELAAEVIKLGNHGALTSTSSSLLAAVAPRQAIISSQDSPSEVILERLAAADATVYRTDLLGAVCVDIGAYGYRVYAQAEPVVEVWLPLLMCAEVDAPDVRILNIQADGVVPISESDEYCELVNDGGPASLAGWRLNAGQEGQDVVFSDEAMLPRYGRCRIYTNEVHEDSCAGCTFGSTVPVWNNAHDCGHLFDASGRLVSSFCY